MIISLIIIKIVRILIRIILMLDKNGDGKISKRELRRFYNQI